MKTPGKPCASCPWRRAAGAADIPNFDLDLAEKLADTCLITGAWDRILALVCLRVINHGKGRNSHVLAGWPKSDTAIRQCALL